MSVAAVAAMNCNGGYTSVLFRIRCSSNGKPRKGFGPQEFRERTMSRDRKDMVLREPSSRQSVSSPQKAPGLSSRLDGIYSDPQFEERLQSVRRSALQKKKSEQAKDSGVIDYDAPIDRKEKTLGFGTKIGVGIAAVIFGLVFAFGDFLPSGSLSTSEDGNTVARKLTKADRAALEARLQQYEVTLSSSSKDLAALEGAAVVSAELGEYTKAAGFLEELTQERPSDPDVFRLLGDVKFEVKDYEASEKAYRIAAKASKVIDFEVLRGLTNTLLAAKKPNEAVKILLDCRSHGNIVQGEDPTTKIRLEEKASTSLDPVQIELLLGKAYSDWGHINDATSVYEQLISSHPDDFRGYLAKGILSKENGNVGEAERMFIQARFFAPDNAKTLVDRYARH